MASRSAGFGFGAEPTFRLTPSRGLLNQLAEAGVMHTADSNSRGIIAFLIAFVLCVSAKRVPNQIDPTLAGRCLGNAQRRRVAAWRDLWLRGIPRDFAKAQGQGQAR